MATVTLVEPDAVSEEELKNWVNERVSAKFQRLAKVVIMEDFPRNVAGKILKREMREPYWKGQETKI
jgi:acyl-coenzyme A synthetase/AMP-(fatty) acid ligase